MSGIVYLITPGEATATDFNASRDAILQTVEYAVNLGVDMIQIREKQLPARLLFELTRDVVEAARGSETKILVNDRFDIAMAAGADGVHLTSVSMPTEAVRAMTPKEVVIGVSTHSLASAEAAKNAGAQFVVLGPVFETPGKDTPLGLEQFRAACETLSSFPVIALGGINLENAESAMEAGAAGVAGIGAFNEVQSLKVLCRDRKEW